MTRDEWDAISGIALGEWWGKPQDEMRRGAWYEMLKTYTPVDVQQAFERLLLTTPDFPPALGRVLTELQPQTATFDEVWNGFVKLCSRCSPTYSGEKEFLAQAREKLGPEAAGWIAVYGARRLSLEPYLDEREGSFILSRIRNSFKDQMSSHQSRTAALRALESKLLDAPIVPELTTGDEEEADAE